MAKQQVPCSSRKDTQWPKPEIQQTFQIQIEDLQKYRSWIQKQITRLPLDAYRGYQTRKLCTLSLTHPPPFFNMR